jgi:ketosteroid isomerase-like protein
MPAVKNVGEPCAREPHARFEVAARGNQASRLSPCGPGASRRPYRGDYSSVEWAHREIEFVFVDGPSPGTWTGVAAMAEGWRDLFTAWEGVRAEVDGYRELDGERVLVLARMRARGRTSGLEIGEMGGKGATVFHVRGGEVAKMVVYFDYERALADLGLTPEAG